MVSISFPRGDVSLSITTLVLKIESEGLDVLGIKYLASSSITSNPIIGGRGHAKSICRAIQKVCFF